MAVTPQAIAGWGTSAKYIWETSFGTTGTPAYPFGYEVKVAVNRNNNLERRYGIGSRNSQYTNPKQFEGSMTIDFVMGNAYWLKGVIGAQGAAGGGGPYTHAFTEANIPPSMTVALSADTDSAGSGDLVTTYSGVIIKSAKLTLAVNDPVRVSLECLYQTESTAAGAAFSQPADTYSEPLLFEHGSITYAGQTLGLANSGIVQSAEVTINNNSELLWGIGSRIAVAQLPKARNYDIRLSYVLTSFSQSTDIFEGFLGDTSTPFTPAAGNFTGATVVMTISNGGATTALRSLVMTFANNDCYFNTSSLTFDINEPFKDGVEGWAQAINTCVWTDNNNAGPGV